MRVTNGIPLGCPFSYNCTSSHCKLGPNTEGIVKVLVEGGVRLTMNSTATTLMTSHSTEGIVKVLIEEGAASSCTLPPH
jgi:hypothetical protein